MSCQVCHSRPVYSGSVWCGNNCRFSGKPGSANYQGNVTVTQGTPLCQECNNPAFYDQKNRKFTAGCRKSHSIAANNKGIYNAR